MKSCPQCGLTYPGDARACFVDGVELVEMQDPRVGATIAGRYVIEEVIGTGGMATVYRATHRLVDRPCAVKVMNKELSNDETTRERFRREAKSAQKLAHPNIIEIFDQGETEDGNIFLVMELLHGQTLADLLDEGPLALGRALPIAIQVARALARAHDLEVIHRDMKPENIFLADLGGGRERVVLLDFGIARSMEDKRLTGAGELFGTPQYMAPERITSIDAGPAADLYAVGVILFEMLTRELPLEADSPTGFFVKHMQETPRLLRSVDPNLPEGAERLIAELLQKDPADRPVDAHKVNNELCGIAMAHGVPIPEEFAANEAKSVRAATLPPVAIDVWATRVRTFDRMFETAFSNSGSPEVKRTLDRIHEVVAEIALLRSRSVTEQRHLESIGVRGREGRQRLGHAVDALGVDASKARNEAKQAAAEAARLDAELEQFRERYRASHKEIIHWEGRCAFVQPHPELAAAYRDAAEVLEAWGKERGQIREAKARAEAKRTEVTDLEFQIQELRNALATFQQGIDQEEAQCQAKVAEMGARADRLNTELLQLATAFTTPLRDQPELRPLFQQLEDEAERATSDAGPLRVSGTA